ncbi:MAG: hypothetical protein N3A58_05495 [Spirochaetes bacterium]|nr:hypothetical protein [Spirochaetota bacterium]
MIFIRKRLNYFFIVVLICLLFFSLNIFAQENQDNNKDFFKFNMFFGNSVINGITYFTISLRPTFTFGKISFGFDLYFELDSNGNLRKENDKYVGWSTWQDWMNKILFVQYGFKGEPIYAKIGVIEDATLGHGLIMQNYSNGLYFPEIRKTGFAFDLDGALFNFPYIGFESFIDDIKDIDIIGFRFYVRPLLFLQIPIINQFKVGFSIVSDTDPLSTAPYSDSSSPTDVVSITGLDFEIPLINNESISALYFFDIASIKGKGSGLKTGIHSIFFKIIGLGAEILSYKDKFTAPYFDLLYENKDIRNTKYSTLDLIPGYTGWRIFAFLNILQEIVYTYAEYSGPFGSSTIKPYFIGAIGLNQGIIPFLSFNLYMIRGNIEKFGDIFNWSNPQALLNSYLKMEIKLIPGSGTSSISLIYEIKYKIENGQVVRVSTSYFTTGIQF